ncbi:MAG: carboxypeptidase regulatory-like domain-containing protein, partial [Anaerolineae bacterium]
MLKSRLSLHLVLFVVSLVLLFTLTGCTPSGVSGIVKDASSGAVLANVKISSGESQATSDAKGSFQLSLPYGAQHVTISLEGYRTFETDVTLDNKSRRVTLDTALEPRLLTGAVTDAQTNEALSGVTCQMLDAQVATDSQGKFTLPALTISQVIISKHGYKNYTLEADQLATSFDQNGNLVNELTVSLEPRIVQGTLTEDGTGAPIADATVQIGDQTTTTDAKGSFSLSFVDPGEKISITSAAYRIPNDMTYDGEASLALSLKPYQAVLTIQDAESGDLLPEAQIDVTSGKVTLQDDGSRLARIVPGTIITASLVGYKNGTATYNGEEALTIKLAPAQLVGQLTAADSGKPISNAVILAYTQLADPVVLRSDKDGRFYYPEDNPVSKILIKAPGYERVSMPITRTGMLRLSLAPFSVKALYIPFGLLYDRAAFEAVLDLAKDTEINGLVVDLKDDWAKTAWDSQVPLAKEIGAYNPDVMDAKDVIALAHERGLYVVGRLVVFKDNQLAKAHPE